MKIIKKNQVITVVILAAFLIFVLSPAVSANGNITGDAEFMTYMEQIAEDIEEIHEDMHTVAFAMKIIALSTAAIAVLMFLILIVLFIFYRKKV